MPFRPFGPDHLAALAVTAVVCGAVIWRGRALGDGARRWVRYTLAAVLVGYAVSFYAVTVASRGFRWDESLPLNVCDVVLFWRRGGATGPQPARV